MVLVDLAGISKTIKIVAYASVRGSDVYVAFVLRVLTSRTQATYCRVTEALAVRDCVSVVEWRRGSSTAQCSCFQTDAPSCNRYGCYYISCIICLDNNVTYESIVFRTCYCYDTVTDTILSYSLIWMFKEKLIG